ncbi:MAG: hypothetical protein J7639_13765 [Paenibacillaceae bacterium]|nr:hypothetical protein [Paenibacillaceae bacterium]
MKVLRISLYVLPMRARMPFRYGIAELTSLPHVFVRADIESNGKRQTGVAADGLPPKWFTKHPQTTFRDDLADMLRVIRQAAHFAQQVEAESVYGWWREVAALQTRWAEDRHGYPPLLSGFGVSLVERAVIDAFCRMKQLTFGQALRTNEFGIRLGDLYEELKGLQPAELLPEQPLTEAAVRHTVGLTDPLGEDDIPDAERVTDGLPQSLESCIARYGLSYFKIKLCGDGERDLARLAQIAALFARIGLESFAFTLDGNEQYAAIEPFRMFWEQLSRRQELAAFMKRLLFVEQPVRRDAALQAAAGEALRDWRGRPPVIIDESGGTLGDLTTALALGYAGASHKNCKGIIKGIAGACLLARRNNREAGARLVLSGEDLGNVGPVALLQDLTVMANLGIRHVERNGHHYFAGLSMFPPDMKAQALAHHGDLYRMHEAGFPTLDIREGRIRLSSLLAAPFGVAALPPFGQLSPVRSLDDLLQDNIITGGTQ